MKRKHLLIIATVVTTVILGFIALPGRHGGHRWLFSDKQFHFQAFRTLGHAVYQGALPGEVMAVLPRISDDETWCREWTTLADRCVETARLAADDVSRGNALLRASNYYRAAEFFLPPRGKGLEQRRDLHHQSIAAFREALRRLGVRHTVYAVPFGGGKIPVYYFPGRADRPVVIVYGGFDSTTEEIWFITGAALVERGYTVVLTEGPGQSSMIRDYGIRFTPDWHKPVGAVIDHLYGADPSLRGRTTVLVGASFGGILAGRTAAIEKRLDGVVLFGAPYDMVRAALFQMPAMGRWMYRHGWDGAINAMIRLKARGDRGLRWGLNNGTWTIGGDTPYGMINAFAPYTLEDVHEKVKCHVLCLYGEKDIYVSDEHQRALFENSFKNAASYTMKIFTEKDGAAEHCQVGAIEQVAAALVGWMKEKGLDRS
jgi:pimeloyl-ACP methyl ester carboxylesterase